MDEKYLGIDFGTSGARAIVIDQAKNIVASVQAKFSDVAPEKLAQTWQTTLHTLISQLPVEIRKQLKAIAINGTSSTVLLCDAAGQPITAPLLYNDPRGKDTLAKISKISPQNHLVNSATSTLAKLLWWQQQPYFSQAHYLLHQADWLAYLLHGRLGVSDYHNALKLGYNVTTLDYPNWLQNLPFSGLYPQVLSPGASIREVTPENCQQFELSTSCLVCAGTTDSIAAFLASEAKQPGEAVTSLGSTLVLKLLSQTKIDAPKYGIYSHRLGQLWLTGGASNTGGAVLKHFFSARQLEKLSAQINPELAATLDYYPLLKPGDRFPINEPNLQPRLEPRPADDVEFLHGLLESMSRIESIGYQKLQDLGADKITQVYTAGGGARNMVWSKIRQRHLQVPVGKATNIQAAYGTALLAAGKSVITVCE